MACVACAVRCAGIVGARMMSNAAQHPAAAMARSGARCAALTWPYIPTARIVLWSAW